MGELSIDKPLVWLGPRAAGTFGCQPAATWHCPTPPAPFLLITFQRWLSQTEKKKEEEEEKEKKAQSEESPENDTFSHKEPLNDVGAARALPPDLPAAGKISLFFFFKPVATIYSP